MRPARWRYPHRVPSDEAFPQTLFQYRQPRNRAPVSCSTFCEGTARTLPQHGIPRHPPRLARHFCYRSVFFGRPLSIRVLRPRARGGSLAICMLGAMPSDRARMALYTSKRAELLHLNGNRIE
jgi:hypothetical protein